MKKLIILIIYLTINSCSSPNEAADKTCDCLQETVRIWENDEKLDAVVKFTECGKMQEDYKKQFSGSDLTKFNETYDKCLQENIKGELLRYFLK